MACQAKSSSSREKITISLGPANPPIWSKVSSGRCTGSIAISTAIPQPSLLTGRPRGPVPISRYSGGGSSHRNPQLLRCGHWNKFEEFDRRAARCFEMRVVFEKLYGIVHRVGLNDRVPADYQFTGRYISRFDMFAVSERRTEINNRISRGDSENKLSSF